MIAQVHKNHKLLRSKNLPGCWYVYSLYSRVTVCLIALLSCEQFVLDHKLAGAAKNVIKTKTKEHLIDDYKQLFATKVK